MRRLSLWESWHGKAVTERALAAPGQRHALSASLRSAAPPKGEPIAARPSAPAESEATTSSTISCICPRRCSNFPIQLLLSSQMRRLSLWESWHGKAVTERALAAPGQRHALSASLRSAAPPKGEPIAARPSAPAESEATTSSTISCICPRRCSNFPIQLLLSSQMRRLSLWESWHGEAVTERACRSRGACFD